MPILKSKTTEWTFTPDEVKKLIAHDLGKKPDEISVRYVIEEVGGDPLDRYRGVDTVTKIRVTVEEK